MNDSEVSVFLCLYLRHASWIATAAHIRHPGDSVVAKASYRKTIVSRHQSERRRREPLHERAAEAPREELVAAEVARAEHAAALDAVPEDLAALPPEGSESSDTHRRPSLPPTAAVRTAALSAESRGAGASASSTTLRFVASGSSLASSSPSHLHLRIRPRCRPAGLSAGHAELDPDVPHVHGVDHAPEHGDGGGEPPVYEHAHERAADGERVEEEGVDHEPGGAGE
ncbi:hypothetical protein ACMD2_07708, partial [Ananas comosus]